MTRRKSGSGYSLQSFVSLKKETKGFSLLSLMQHDVKKDFFRFPEFKENKYLFHFKI